MQAVALVFEHVGTALTSSPDKGQAAVLESDQEQGLQRKGGAVLAQQGAANAALKLLDDLCMMTTGDKLYKARAPKCVHTIRGDHHCNSLRV